MGMSIYANLAYGTKLSNVYYKDREECDILEYMEYLLDQELPEISYEVIGTYESEDYMLFILDTQKYTNWDALLLDEKLEKPSQEKINKLIEALKILENKFEFRTEPFGYYIWPYYSH